jgi:tetratricopeptide (TPR) repeat protein
LKTSLRLDPKGAQSRGLLGKIYIQLARYRDAVKLLEESLEREPDDPYFKADLAAAYALAGRLDDARKAAQDIIEVRTARGYRSTVVGEFGRNFLAHPDYRDHLREGLLLAGIPERAVAVDLKLLPENQLSGAQLRELKKAGEMTRGKRTGGQWRVDHLANGTGVHYWLGKEFGRSDWSIEGDQLLIRYRAPLKRDPYRCDIYRNPAGSKETLDEYIANCTIGVWPYAGFPITGNQ